MIPTLRTLTKRSKLGFGKYKNETVQKLIDTKLELNLISAYYKLTSINYTPEILDELNITEKYRIQKPGSDREMYYKYLEASKYKMRKRGVGAEHLKKMTKAPSKTQLQRKNQGH